MIEKVGIQCIRCEEYLVIQKTNPFIFIPKTDIGLSKTVFIVSANETFKYRYYLIRQRYYFHPFFQTFISLGTERNRRNEQEMNSIDIRSIYIDLID